jgi:tetratricopeptide (TPR) repeat protein
LVACGASVAGFLVHSLADAPNASKTVLVPLAVVLALMVRAVPARSGSEAAPGPDEGNDPAPAAPRAGAWRRCLVLLPPVTVLVALVALLFFWSNLDGPHYRYSQGLEDADAGRWLEAVPHFQRAADDDPDFALYQLQLGLSETMAYLGGAPRPLLEQGIEHLERGVALEPRSAVGHANLARAYLLANRLPEARDSALEAIRWAGHDPEVAIAAASVVEKAGTAEDAREAYATAIALDASMAFS